MGRRLCIARESRPLERLRERFKFDLIRVHLRGVYSRVAEQRPESGNVAAALA
jgi:hypothetical protein